MAGSFITEFPIPTAASRPSGIAAGPDGNLWFTESFANQIARITPAGVVTEFPLPTANSDPQGIVAGPDGNLWVKAQLGPPFTPIPPGGQILRITPAGVVTGEFCGPGFWNPGIAAGPDGNLYYCRGDSPLGGIYQVNPTTGSCFSFVPGNPAPTSAAFPRCIAAGPDGNLWFTEYWSNRIARITLPMPVAAVLTEFPIPTANSAPDGIAAGPDGNLWFTESAANQIGRITPAGAITEFPLPTANSGPVGIATGPDGNLWFTESLANKIGRITPAGVVTEFPLPTANSGPERIAAGPDCNLWFTESAANQIGRITLAPPIVIGDCASDQTVYATSCAGAVVSYPALAVSGGCGPVSLTCTPLSGTGFAVGQTTVACTAQDAFGNTALCTFKVTVKFGNRCPLTKGYWGNRADVWPNAALPMTLGNQTYSQAQLLAILSTSTTSDASIILARQQIAAILNTANSSDPRPICGTITQAQNLLVQAQALCNCTLLPYNIKPSSALGQAMVNQANILTRYNEGRLTAGCTNY